MNKPQFRFLLFVLSAMQLAPALAVPMDVTKEKHVPVVRVNATNQAYDFLRPWSKKAPASMQALGPVIANRRVLVTAEMVANSNYVELEKAESGERTAATVEAVDYEANLALLKPSDEKFLAEIKPLEIKHAVVGDRVALWQLESTGALLITGALITTVEVARYSIDDAAFLTYRMTTPLQYRESSFTLPVVKDNKLVALLMRYDARSQNVDAIPAPVIEHFLKDAAGKEYQGFPRTGLLYDTTRDPQLRRYAGLTDETPGGVYVTHIQKGGPADKAGLQEGDVILAANNKPIDQDGNYYDDQYGKVALAHLTSTKTYVGDTMKFKIFRGGKTQTLDVVAAHRAAKDYLIDPYVIGRAPRYYVLGGLVLLELSRQYLKEWGADWSKKAPERFVYYDRYQSDLFHDDRQKIVILSQVLPTANTVGYEELSNLVVTKINGVPLKSLTDVPTALATPANGFHSIEFEENPKQIYLDAKEVEAGNAELIQSYRVRELKRLE
jgi:PDZ domain-containing protein